MAKLEIPFMLGEKRFTIDALVFEREISEKSPELGTFTVDTNGPPEDVARKDSEALLSELAENGLAKEDYVYIPKWKEPVLFLEKSIGASLPLNLEFLAGSSYRAQALRRGYASKPILQAGVVIFAITRDEQIVYGGVRGGDDRAGEVAQVGGSVGYNRKKRHPLFEAITSETHEELGFFPKNLSILGHFFEPSHYRSNNAVFIGEIAGSAREVRQLHEMAFQIYMSEKNRGMPELESRNAIKKAGLPNIDAWEHKVLMTSPYSRANIETYGVILEDSGRFGPISRGSTAVLLEYLK